MLVRQIAAGQDSTILSEGVAGVSQNALFTGRAITTLTVVSLLVAFARIAPGQQQKQLQVPATVQSPFNAMKVRAKFKIGTKADWVALATGSVWVAGTDPYTVQRIDPK